MKRLTRLDIQGRSFVDESGRQAILRGVNLGGDCKVPYPDGGTSCWSDFSDHRTVSFIGRPFPLDEADEHLTRIARWGFNVVRLLTTWEAVEHAGPGIYDTAYLDYFAEVSRRCGEHGLYVFVDFHQDVWSRMTGGDGAPGWTLDAVGLDFTRFHRADAAHIMQAKYDYARGGWQDAYPQMSWAGNNSLPATSIMWTLFFGGRDYAPHFTIDGRNVQDYLQDHYLNSMRQIALRVRDQSHVLGFDTLNEPGHGFIGRELEYRHEAQTAEHPEPIRVGATPSTFDSLLMARGIPRTVSQFIRESPRTMRKTGEGVRNPGGVSIWRDGAQCPFEAEGVYRLQDGVGEVLRPDYFTQMNGRAVNVERDCMVPFFHRVAQAIRSVRDEWLVFAEVSPYVARRGFPPGAPPRCVNASHWYDVQVLRSKKFDYEDVLPSQGATDSAVNELRQRYIDELSVIAAAGDTLSPEGAPTLVGEFGIPYDLDESAAYRAWAAGDRSDAPWEKHAVALRLMYDAMDRLLLSSTQWNYTASNRNAAAGGDNWNQEDLSIFSRDQQADRNDPDSGGRAVAGFCRPYARFVQGTASNMSFDAARGMFTLEYEADPAIELPTEIFVPAARYPRGYETFASNGEVHRSADDSYVRVFARTAGPSTLRIAIP